MDVTGTDADEPVPAPGTRRLRADAHQNRTRIVDAARAVFLSAEAPIRLEDVAHSAGVGIATLYRNFPSRESLVEAVFSAELQVVTSSAEGLLAHAPADVAMRTWLGNYVAFFRTKRALLSSLRPGWTMTQPGTGTTRDLVTLEIARLLAAGARTGTLRPDVTADEVVRLLLGILMTLAPDDPADSTSRVLDLVVDALRTHR